MPDLEIELELEFETHPIRELTPIKERRSSRKILLKGRNNSLIRATSGMIKKNSWVRYADKRVLQKRDIRKLPHNHHSTKKLPESHHSTRKFIPINSFRKNRLKKVITDIPNEDDFNSLSPNSPKLQPLHFIETGDKIVYVTPHLFKMGYDYLNFIEKYVGGDVLILLDYFIANIWRRDYKKNFYKKLHPWNPEKMSMVYRVFLLFEKFNSKNFLNFYKETILYVGNQIAISYYRTHSINYFLDEDDKIETITSALKLIHKLKSASTLFDKMVNARDEFFSAKEDIADMNFEEVKGIISLILIAYGTSFIQKFSTMGLIGLHTMFNIIHLLYSVDIVINPSLEKIKWE